ncbi:MAG: hypothetical protein MUD14_04970 [Hydrococcus sp. Prado102]|jgi:hypothetical protein|nr:hypothetical protein [Hydrococcus sp. Prado102]
MLVVFANGLSYQLMKYMKHMEYLGYREYKETLDDMLDRLLTGEWSLPKFKSEFSRFYLEQVPGEVLSDEEWLFFSTILENLECISATPNPLSKQLGWRCDRPLGSGKADREYIE